jgi:hypothetical protein
MPEASGPPFFAICELWVVLVLQGYIPPTQPSSALGGNRGGV